MRFLAPLFLIAILPAACNDPTGPKLEEADTRILFIGNSLTYTNDLPGAVATIAATLGHDVSVYGITAPNFALEDHYLVGVASDIRELEPDIVVMQQGPSSLPASRAHLIEWTDTLSRVVREVGGIPALYMVWPDLDRFFAFDDVYQSYEAAADQVEGIFLPAGEALRRLHLQRPDLTPYSPDRFHPNETGTILAALVIVGALFDESLAGVPASMPAAGRGGRKVEMIPDEFPLLPEIADEVLVSLTPTGSAPASVVLSPRAPLR